MDIFGFEISRKVSKQAENTPVSDDKTNVQNSNGLTFGSSSSFIPSTGIDYVGNSTAMKLSSVSRAVELISDSIAKLPISVWNEHTRKTVPHALTTLLSLRPCSNLSAFVAFKQVESARLLDGNGYFYIQRDPFNAKPISIHPIRNVSILENSDKEIYYNFTHPTRPEVVMAPQMDVLHFKGFSTDGLRGISVLTRANDVIFGGISSQKYMSNFYKNGGRPSGVLQTDTDLSGTVEIPQEDGTVVKVSYKDLIREEWNRRHAGADNAGNTAVLDKGLKYTPMAISNKDMQFIEQAEITVSDIARFFGIPLYKLQSGKQSYSSNEQNAIEYVVSTLHPIVEQYEQELSYKLLTTGELNSGLRVRLEMLSELRGDVNSRANWYTAMRNNSAYSANDIRRNERLPDIEGGDEYRESLNYVPLADWKELSKNRNGGNSE